MKKNHIIIISIFIIFIINNTYLKYNINEPFTENKKDLLVICDGGFCNKLRTIIGFGYLAKKKNKNLYAVWKKGRECPGYFRELFLSIKNIILLDSSSNLPKNVINYGILNDYIYKNHGTKYNEHLQYYKKLKIKKNILDKINNYIKINNISKCLGVHIRKTDHIEYLKNNNNKQFPIRDYDFYEKEIDKFMKNNNNNIYLATDNKTTQDYFIKKYPNILFYKLIEQSDNLRQTTLEDALIDISILSRCNKFIGTHLSSLTYMVTDFKNYVNL